MGRDRRSDCALLSVAARGVAARYGARPALEALDLELFPGDVVAVLGPNGSGKSTLLRLVSAGMVPAHGELLLLGADARRPTAALRRRIGWAPDQPAHVEALSGRENARFFARACGLSSHQASLAVEPLLERFELDRDADRPVEQYSFGMRRKLALVEALAHQPELLALDEPTTGLDPKGREALRGLLAERAGSGATVTFATNDVREAEAVCSRVLFLLDGRKALEGEPGELIARLGGATRIEVRYAAAETPEIRVEGLEVAAADTGHLVAHASNGTAPLPTLCAALAEQRASIHAVEVRRPDLSDVFLRATGQELGPPGGGTGDSGAER